MRILATVTLAVVASGCSPVKIIYGQADNFIESWVDGFADLDDAGEALVEQKVGEFFAWHRPVMLPRYAALMRRIADIHEQGGLDRATFDRLVGTGEELYDETLREGLPGIAAVLMTLTPEQQRGIDERLAEENEEIRQRLRTSPKEVIDGQTDTAIFVLEFFIGDLEERQLGVVRRRCAVAFDALDLWFEDRLRRQQAMRSLLKSRPTELEIHEFLKVWILQPKKLRSPAYARHVVKARREMEEMLFEVLRLLTNDQRVEFIDNLRAYAEDLLELSVE